MKRRDFLKLGLAGAIVSGCDSEYFQASPYEILTENSDLTNANIYEISKRSGNEKSSFKFPVVSDTHSFYNDFNDIQKAIKAKKEEYPFLVCSGDMTNSGLKWEYEQTDDILQKAGLPYLTVIGNHDAITNGKRIYARLYGPYNYSTTYNGAKLIFFNNNTWEFGSSVPDYSWIESELASASADQPIILICHIPPLQDERFNKTQQERFRKLVADYGVDFVLNGHNHGHTSRMVEGVTYLTNGSPENRLYSEISVDYNSEGGHSVSFTAIYI